MVHDEMSDTFRLAALIVTIDGVERYACPQEEQSRLVLGEGLLVIDDTISAGPQEVVVEAIFPGHGYGVFS